MDSLSLAHAKWKCQYHIVFIPKYRRKVLYGKIRVDVKEAIKKYIAEQEVYAKAEDQPKKRFF